MPDKWEKIGVFGVDSGLCIIADPGYILHKEDKHKDLGEDWPSFLERFKEQFDGNPEFEKWLEKAKAGEVAGVMPSMLTKTKDFRHQLKFDKGHAGLAVVTPTGVGDGMYQVFARKNERGEVLELKIDFETIPEEYR